MATLLTPEHIAEIRANYAQTASTFKAGIKQAQLSAHMQSLRHESWESIERAILHACDLSYELGKLQQNLAHFEASL